MTTTDILMVIFTGTIAITGIIGAVIFGKQLAAMQGQLDETKSGGADTKRAADAAMKAAEIADNTLASTQRPWVNASTVQIRGAMSRNVNGLNITLGYNLKNIGNTPALHALIHQKMIVWRNNVDLSAELKKFSDEVRPPPDMLSLSQTAHIGSFIFPNDTESFSIGSTLSPSELVAEPPNPIFS